ncbi:GNAT family N-acetyltransferase [Vibrio zhugei]|nr:GNAT family N-acetyltransferase [Vibrio zhugei]
MQSVITVALGWDEKFQRNGFESRLHPEWFRWVYCNNEKVGLVCSHLTDNSLHVHLLIIFTEAQRKGIAFKVLNLLEFEANNHNLNVTLSCFKNNKPALSMYYKLGYSVSSEDEYFYNFISHSEKT